MRAGVERRSQGRAALARSLAQRGLDRSVIDEALAELPDDDAERALEFARSKARSLARLDPDTALRRLVGQLARRGFGGGVAMNAAKQALREASSGGGSGVRFRESE
ncbi:regulatory protein RecX [Microbacterium sp. NIBRBAC000506063]|uniref:regulatory protein RecX n=1 Tax=Microbacterium sp. NIBRBAC000506063 TaxID=2734618 RepID=UPI00398114F1